MKNAGFYFESVTRIMEVLGKKLVDATFHSQAGNHSHGAILKSYHCALKVDHLEKPRGKPLTNQSFS